MALVSQDGVKKHSSEATSTLEATQNPSEEANSTLDPVSEPSEEVPATLKAHWNAPGKPMASLDEVKNAPAKPLFTRMAFVLCMLRFDISIEAVHRRGRAKTFQKARPRSFTDRN